MAYRFCPIPCITKSKVSSGISNACWYCELEDSMGDKFIAKKSSDPIPAEIRRVQKKLGFLPGEPLTGKNLHKITTVENRSCKDDRNSQIASPATPIQIASPNGQSSLKRTLEKHDDPPLKRMNLLSANLPVKTVTKNPAHPTLPICGCDSSPDDRCNAINTNFDILEANSRSLVPINPHTLLHVK